MTYILFVIMSGTDDSGHHFDWYTIVECYSQYVDYNADNLYKVTYANIEYFVSGKVKGVPSSIVGTTSPNTLISQLSVW